MPPSASKSSPRVERSRARTAPVAVATLTSIAAFFSPQVRAQDAAGQPEQVVITASGVERRLFDTPYAVGVVDAQALRAAGPMVNLSEALARVPGLVVANRSNYAQDLQINSRGFGARAGFGVRGMRLYADGIPASGPDGQGQVSHFDLAGAQRIEVLRGPFTALYGSSSGGVISLVSAAPKERRWSMATSALTAGARCGWASRRRLKGASACGPRSAASRPMAFDPSRPPRAAWATCVWAGRVHATVWLWWSTRWTSPPWTRWV